MTCIRCGRTNTSLLWTKYVWFALFTVALSCHVDAQTDGSSNKSQGKQGQNQPPSTDVGSSLSIGDASTPGDSSTVPPIVAGSGSQQIITEAFPPGVTIQESTSPGVVPVIPFGSGQPLAVVDFRDETLDQVIRVFSEQSGLNLVASEDANKKRINLFLRNVRPKDVLENLTKTHDLFYRVDESSGIVRIFTTEEYDRNLASFREEQTEVFTLLYPNPVDVAVAIRDLFGDRVQLNFGVGDEDAALDLAFRLNRFDLIDSRSLGLGSFTGQPAFSGRNFNNIGGLGGFRSNNRFPGRANGNFGLTDESQRLRGLDAEQIQQLIDAIESKQTQPQAQAEPPVLPEGEDAIQQLLRERRATIFVTVVRRNNQVIIRTGDSQTMKQVASLIQRLDIPTPLVLLEVKVMSVALDDDFRSTFDYQYSDGSTNTGGFTTGDILNSSAAGLVGEARRAASLLPGGSVLSQGDLTFQVVSDNFRARMQLLEDDNRVTVLNTPLLLTANNEVSRIFIGDTIPFTVGFNSPQVISGGVANTTVAGTPITELRDVGQSLLITPSINADRTVTLRIVQESASRVIDGGKIPVLSASGAIINQEVDTVNRSTISGTIVAKDGLAVALGGLIEEEVSDQREQVPVIGKLPVLGFFFRRQETGRSRQELIVMVRPYIFNTPAESAALSEDLLQNLSVHPRAVTGAQTLNTFSPDEVVRTDLDECNLHREFRFHNVLPRAY